MFQRRYSTATVEFLRPLQKTAALCLFETFRPLHPTAPRQGILHGFTGERRGEKIDYILASEAFRTLETNILYDNTEGRYPFDHFSLTIRLRLED